MTLLEPRLALRRLVVISRGCKVYDQQFHDGVNIIRGRNSSGKSTIADFIFFALGGDFNHWKFEAERCQEVFAEVEINTEFLTLRRTVTPKLKQPLYIFWDKYEKASASAVEGWQMYPFSRLEPKESYSQVLFRALGLPEVKTETESSITMHQLLRLMYVDQISGVESLFRNEDFDHHLMRQAVGDLMIGIYDESVYSEELTLKQKQRELEEAKRESDSLVKLFADIEQETDMESLQNNIAQANEQLDRLTAALEVDSTKISGSDAVEARQRLDVQRNKVLEIRQHYNSALEDKSRQELEISDSSEFIQSLERRLKALGESLETSLSFGEVELSHCPKCLSPLTPLPEGEHDHCTLCRNPLPIDARKIQTLRMQQELSLQIKESNAILIDKRSRLQQISDAIPFLTQKLINSEREMSQLLNEVRTERDAERDSLVLKKGQLEGHLQFLHQQARTAALLADLRKRKATLQSEIERLGISIQSKRKTKAERLMKAHERLEFFTALLLHDDLSRESLFKTAKEVKIDFRGDSFSVDGRNQFSASSMTYLRNSVHFALLFSSLELDFMRYPRFILCDNIEDKGMEEVRSRNFQRLIADISNKIPVAHQIIFTTSMIDASLDTDTYCIGTAYDDTHHTLEFPAD